MKIKVFDSELNVMELLWEEGDLTASDISKIMKVKTGWVANTTYTVIGKLIEKGAIERYGKFTCKALITKEQVQQDEATEIVDKLFDGSADVFLSAFLNGKKLNEAEIARLKQLVENLK
jgi:predicted transcriptional regulator